MDIGITDVVDGSYKDFSAANITAGANLVEALYASLSVAGFFPPADVLNSYYFDGSAVWDIDIFTAVNRCKDLGFAEEDIVVDVIMTSSANLKDVDASDFKSLQMLMRYAEISSFYNSMDGLLRAKFAYQKANFRYVVSPTGSIGSAMTPFSMSEKKVQSAYDLGFSDAQKVAANSTQSLDDLIHYHALKKTGNNDVRKYSFGTFQAAKKEGKFDDYDIMQDPYMRKYTVKAMKK